MLFKKMTTTSARNKADKKTNLSVFAEKWRTRRIALTKFRGEHSLVQADRYENSLQRAQLEPRMQRTEPVFV